MQRLNEIHELYTYNRWANARILAAAGALSDERFTRNLKSSFASVRDTLVHLLGAEWVWLSRWKGTSPGEMPDELARADCDTLRTMWAEVEEEQQRFLDGLTEDGLDEGVAYEDMVGRPFETPLWQMLRHVVNHSSYHRGQVVTMLRQLGVDPSSTDLILFYRSGGAGAGA